MSMKVGSSTGCQAKLKEESEGIYSRESGE